MHFLLILSCVILIVGDSVGALVVGELRNLFSCGLLPQIIARGFLPNTADFQTDIFSMDKE